MSAYRRAGTEKSLKYDQPRTTLKRMKRSLHVMAAAALLAVFSVSCQTAPVAQREGRVNRLLVELNRASVDRLMELSARPFLLDGEIVLLESDLEMMWTNLRDAGFTFEAPALRELGPVDDQTWRRFGTTMDVRVWFEKYAAEDAALAEVATTHGTFLIITGDRVPGHLPQIFGFTGPQGGS